MRDMGYFDGQTPEENRRLAMEWFRLTETELSEEERMASEDHEPETRCGYMPKEMSDCMSTRFGHKMVVPFSEAEGWVENMEHRIIWPRATAGLSFPIIGGSKEVQQEVQARINETLDTQENQYLRDAPQVLQHHRFLYGLRNLWLNLSGDPIAPLR